MCFVVFGCVGFDCNELFYEWVVIFVDDVEVVFFDLVDDFVLVGFLEIIYFRILFFSVSGLVY